MRVLSSTCACRWHLSRLRCAASARAWLYSIPTAMSPPPSAFLYAVHSTLCASPSRLTAERGVTTSGFTSESQRWSSTGRSDIVLTCLGVGGVSIVAGTPRGSASSPLFTAGRSPAKSGCAARPPSATAARFELVMTGVTGDGGPRPCSSAPRAGWSCRGVLLLRPDWSRPPRPLRQGAASAPAGLLSSSSLSWLDVRIRCGMEYCDCDCAESLRLCEVEPWTDLLMRTLAARGGANGSLCSSSPPPLSSSPARWNRRLCTSRR
mmetsp:Transcript_7875/g.18106  ORF Transcript_7875/g.18106 Transcript_7875/m.18106 type:complete len:264 (-) Transcript_7875:622-1413(-)